MSEKIPSNELPDHLKNLLQHPFWAMVGSAEERQSGSVGRRVDFHTMGMLRGKQSLFLFSGGKFIDLSEEVIGVEYENLSLDTLFSFLVEMFEVEIKEQLVDEDDERNLYV